MMHQDKLHLVRLTNNFNHKFLNIGRPTKVMDLGFTEIPEDIFLEFLREVSPRFT